jgi:hypothetical protein
MILVNNGNTFSLSSNIIQLTPTTGVGIGTATPDNTIDAVGSIVAAPATFSGASNYGLFFRRGFSTSNFYNCSVLAYDHNADTNPDGISINGYDGVSICTGSNSRQERLRVTTGGNVGIGVTNPNATCQIYKGSGVCSLSVQTGDTASFSQIGCFNAEGSFAGIFFNGSGRTADGGANTATLRNDAGDLRLSASGNSPYIYLTGGNVGINTPSPGVPLEVNGAATFGNPWWIITGNGGNATYNAGQVWGSSAVNGTYYGSLVYTGGGASSSQWNGSTGIFTFPQKGVYSITICMFINASVAGRWARMSISSSVSGSSDQYMDFDPTNYSGNNQRNFKLVRYFNANDTFYCQTEGGSITLYWALVHTVFFINKIG